MAFSFDIGTILNLIQTAFSVRQTIRDGGDFQTILTKVLPQIVPIVGQIGNTLFPGLTQQQQTQAGIQVMFDSDKTKWIQATLNKLTNAGLAVDGKYGNATKSAVTAFQAGRKDADGNPLQVDGWAGLKTQAVMTAELAKLPAP